MKVVEENLLIRIYQNTESKKKKKKAIDFNPKFAY